MLRFRRQLLGLACVALAGSMVGCAHAPSPASQGRGHAPNGDPDFLGEGLASFYGPGLYGHRTASGERLEPGTMTAAHRTLRFGACVRVVNVANGKEVRVRVNDRGPYVGSRIMDVSELAARRLGMVERGVTRVQLYRCGGEGVSFQLPESEPGELVAWVDPGDAWSPCL